MDSEQLQVFKQRYHTQEVIHEIERVHELATPDRVYSAIGQNKHSNEAGVVSLLAQAIGWLLLGNLHEAQRCIYHADRRLSSVREAQNEGSANRIDGEVEP